jgi:hypothetical protein
MARAAFICPSNENAAFDHGYSTPVQDLAQRDIKAPSDEYVGYVERAI